MISNNYFEENNSTILVHSTTVTVVNIYMYSSVEVQSCRRSSSRATEICRLLL